MEQQNQPLLKLLTEKQQLFECYEALTGQLAEENDPAAMEDYITQRGELANKIDALNQNLQMQLDNWGEAGGFILSSTCQREECPEELLPVFDLNQQILALIRRIRLRDTEITREYQRIRAESLERIKAASNLPKINRYLSSLSSPEDANNFGRV